MADRLRVKLVGAPFKNGAVLPWINLRFEDMDSGRVVPIARDRIVLKQKDNAVVAEVSLLIHTVEIEDPCLQSIGDEIVMIPEDASRRIATINGVLVCQCHAVKPSDTVRALDDDSEGVDKTNQ